VSKQADMEMTRATSVVVQVENMALATTTIPVTGEMLETHMAAILAVVVTITDLDLQRS